MFSSFLVQPVDYDPGPSQMDLDRRVSSRVGQRLVGVQVLAS